MPRMLKPRTSLDQMLSAFLVLLACELAGDLLRQVLALPVPGPVIGMTILVAALIFKRKAPTFHSPVIVSLEQTSEALIRHMGLLFVPAGVGLIAKMQVLRSEWIAAGLIGSTLLSLAVTGLVILEHSPSCCEATARHCPAPGEGPSRTAANGAIDHLWNSLGAAPLL